MQRCDCELQCAPQRSELYYEAGEQLEVQDSHCCCCPGFTYPVQQSAAEPVPADWSVASPAAAADARQMPALAELQSGCVYFEQSCCHQILQDT